MGKVVAIHQKRFFDLDEARDLFPVILRLTKTAHQKARFLNAQLNYVKDKEKKTILENQIQGVFQEWQAKVRKLGCEAKGMWLVDFDNGEGYFCWHYPEPDIHYYHGYLDGYRGRVKVH